MIRSRLMLITVGVLAVVVATGLAVAATQRETGPKEGIGPVSPPRSTTRGTPSPSILTTHQAAQAFLDRYVDADGRVVRHDQGGDTVSEGQAYALLVAAGDGDRQTFNRVWDWTQQNLMRPDGLLAWRWLEGKVSDPSSASDADLDAARALVLAGQKFSDPTWTSAGNALGRSILDHETKITAEGRVLVAGSWADHDPYAYNPSYPSPVAFEVLAAASNDNRWNQLAAGSRAATVAVLTKTGLPPDWAQLHSNGTIDPMPGAAGRGNDGVRYSYDAARMPIRLAESCTPADRGLAARMQTAAQTFPGNFAARDLGGKPLTQDRSVVAAIANAAIWSAAGDDNAARKDLQRADLLQQHSPSYYGAAWVALGSMMLTGNQLGGCPPMELRS